MKISDFRIYVRKLAILCFCLCFVMLAQVHANTLTVTKAVDSNDGVCNADCSLREAIAVAKNNDTILFETGAFVNLTQGELRITRDLIIVGTNKTKLTITRDSSASPAARIFFVQAGASLTLTNTVVTGGTEERDFGGGILNEGTLTLINTEVTGNSASNGGGIENRGTLNLINSTISNNGAFGQGIPARGGGIGNRGTLNSINSTISNNTVFAFSASTRGGGIESSGTMSLINTTISNNLASASNSFIMFGGFGGGIFIQDSGSMTVLRNVTIAGNSAIQGSGGGIYVNDTQISLGNTIVANNSARSSENGHDIWGGTINSEGYNLIENTSSVIISGNTTGNILGIDPQLDPNGLRNNGGTTLTIALQPNSPAIDKGKGTIAGVMNDQRGFPRPYDNPNIPNAQDGDGSDIGAFEVQAFRRITYFDYDGDGRADISVFRPSENRWYVLQSSNSQVVQRLFGASGDIPAPADFDGDGKTDFAVFRPSSGDWWYSSSTNSQQVFAHWGASGDIPRPSDFDGDGRADYIVFRPSNSFWYRYGSSSSISNTNFGLAGDKPLVADFDGDGKTDRAIYRSSTGEWWWQSSVDNVQRATRWGISTDKPVPADYDGDGKTDFAVYRRSEGTWYIFNSSNGSSTVIRFGVEEDKPVAADYDGDGRADIAVFRPSEGVWYLLRSTEGFTAIQFGVSTDIPAPNVFVP